MLAKTTVSWQDQRALDSGELELVQYECGALQIPGRGHIPVMRRVGAKSWCWCSVRYMDQADAEAYALACVQVDADRYTGDWYVSVRPLGEVLGYKVDPTQRGAGR